MLTRRNLLKGIAGGAGAVAATPLCKEAQARGAHQLPDDAVGLLYDGTLCIGCRACMSACKEANDMPAEHTALAIGNYWDAPLDISGKTLNVIKAYRSGTATHKDQEQDGFAFTKVSCMHCVDPSCVSACPVSAMTKDPHSGVVHYNVEACIGCRYCVAACPFNVPRFTYDQAIPKISKCQLCQHRMDEGKYAACAEVCPTGATLFGPVIDLKKEIERRRSLTPGTQTTYPRGKIGGTDSFQGPVAHYVERTYGETEIGGTQVLHLSGVRFELLNKPPLPKVAPARISESLQHAIYNNLIAPLGFLGTLAILAWRNMRPKREPAPAGTAAPGPTKPDGGAP
ncbi:MAG: hydrogenase 2 operon protein HybA [Myxococcales bacterium]|nr:hydrogenase 2 operon protein HybA [Myxococcales bacterium]